MSEVLKLLELQNGQIILTEHCYNLQSLNLIMGAYSKEQYMKIYKYFFYMTCPNPELNAFFHEPAATKEEVIIKEIGIDFSLDDVLIQNGLEFCKARYETETARAYIGIKNAYDKLSEYLRTVEYTTGRDGNMTVALMAMKNYTAIRESFKKTREDLDEEQRGVARGKTRLAYDQKKTKKR